MVGRKPASRKAGGKHSTSSFILVAIAVLKLLKAALLIAVGIGAIRFLHKDLATSAMHWVEVLRVDPDNRFVHRFLEKIFRVTPKELKALSVGTFFYASLFLTEGIGLLMRKRWAEWFTIVTTGLLLPLEGYELAAHFTVTRVVVLTVNALIVAYLVARVRGRV
jgi:uncharacterized membrane protein (DUF2068 family)